MLLLNDDDDYDDYDDNEDDDDVEGECDGYEGFWNQNTHLLPKVMTSDDDDDDYDDYDDEEDEDDDDDDDGPSNGVILKNRFLLE